MGASRSRIGTSMAAKHATSIGSNIVALRVGSGARWPARTRSEHPSTADEAAIPTQCVSRADALLTIRLPFETFYNSLTDELRRGELESAGIAAGASEGQGQTIIDRGGASMRGARGGNRRSDYA